LGSIRLFLALSVAVTHLTEASSAGVNGYLAVLCFYIISGFYMSMVLNGRYSGPGGTKAFYAARYLRLYPAYAFTAVMAVFVFYAFYPDRLALPSPSQRPFAWALDLFANATMVGTDLLMLPPIKSNDMMRLIGPAWSIGVELQFYLLAPFIVRRSLKLCVGLLLCSLMVRFLMLGLAYDPWRYYFAPSTFCFFMLGAVAHRLAVLFPYQALKRRIGTVALGALPVLGYLTGVNVTGDIDIVPTWIFFAAFTASIPFVFEFSKNIRLDNLVGQLSYPLYLVHRLTFASLAALLGVKELALADSWLRGGICLAIAILAAAGLYLLIEKPVETLRARLKAPLSKPSTAKLRSELQPAAVD
jgi:peptidoglycan/LPS O-acetylase OafA/YrhL